MKNVVINTCEKFHYDRLRNDKALADRKCDNNKKKSNNKNNVRSAWRPVSESKNCNYTQITNSIEACAVHNEMRTW